ncbi:MAG: hypothetical protein CMG90_05725 [Marinobacter sp.]|nr:hypothetical protein [Marinobacter sp.]
MTKADKLLGQAYDHLKISGLSDSEKYKKIEDIVALRIPANVTGHSGDRDRFAHGHHTGVGFVL